MKRYRLKNDVTVKFNGGGNPADGYDVHGQKGAPVRCLKDGMGNDCFAMNGTVAPGVASIFAHDAKYYYVWVDASHVEEIAST